MSNKKKFKELTDLTQKIAKENEPAFLKLRIKELEEELATANHYWGVVSERLDWLEDRMAPENAGKSFVIELCDDYRDRFFEITEDGIQPTGVEISRAAKTARERKE